MGIQKNIFSGKSDSLTIIGGNQVIKKDNMFENYYPLFLTNEMNYEKFSNTRNNYLNKFLITHNQQVNPINEINFTHKCQEN